MFTKSFRVFFRTLWHAAFTPGGIGAILLATLSAWSSIRPLNLIGFLFPQLQSILDLCLSPILSFAAGALICSAVQQQTRLSSASNRIPLQELRDFAKASGWRFDDATSQHRADFINAIRQSALDGDLRIWGQSGEFRFDELIRSPYLTIAPSHWQRFELSELELFMSPTNYDVQSHDGLKSETSYCDLQVDHDEAIWWLRHIAIRERGKAKKSLERIEDNG